MVYSALHSMHATESSKTLHVHELSERNGRCTRRKIYFHFFSVPVNQIITNNIFRPQLQENLYGVHVREHRNFYLSQLSN